MRIVCLAENTSGINLPAEHGLSLYLETQGHRILFDMGQSDLFLRNAKQLDVDLSAVDLAVVSHGHYDHGGGLEAFLAVNDHAPVYMHEAALERHCARQDREIGLDPKLQGHSQIILTGDEMVLGERMRLFSGNRKAAPYPTDSDGFTAISGGEVARDDFRHEQYLLIREGLKTYLISGCSHKGIQNIMNWMRTCPPDLVIGGFHLSKVLLDETGKQRLDEIACTLLEYPSVYWTCHCTGSAQYRYLKNRMREKLEYLSAGDDKIIQ